jgi:hypothetical protein
MCVLGVLPLWLDTIFEQIVCGHGLQLTWRLDVVVQTAQRNGHIAHEEYSDRCKTPTSNQLASWHQ